MNIENKIKTSIEQEKLENELSHKKYEWENLNEEKAKFINQQKEFINYLEKHKNKEPFIVANICSSYDLTQIKLNILKDILQKYKIIIGYKDE